MHNVYIIGDSISLGYTPEVAKTLEGQATVTHSPGNSQYTSWGLRHLKTWLGDAKYDLIHFNFGIWDLHHLKPEADPLEPSVSALVPVGVRRTTDAQYEANLRAIVAILKTTGAKLIWAAITPIKVSDKLAAHGGQEIHYNAIAKRVMDENGIPINDLHTHALPELARILSEDDVHLNDAGNRYLGEKVAATIRAALQTNHSMKPKASMKLAAAQILSIKGRLMELLKNEPVKRNEYFQKYNISAGTYDAAFCRAHAEEYLTYLDEQVRYAASQNVELLLFPEFAFVPGVMAEPHLSLGKNPNARADALKLYRWAAKTYTEWLSRQSKATGMLIGAATNTVRGDKIYNTGLLTDERGQLVLRYEKIHLPCDEIQSVQVGREYTVAETRLGRVAFSICYDIQFPEHQASLAVRGAEIVLHPSGGYTGPGEAVDMGQNRLRVRASDHHMALVYACFGLDPYGCQDSCVIAPNGDVKACVPGNAVGFAIGDVTGVGKRVWPNDKPENPDRETFRRQLRRPSTYRPLVEKIKTH